MAGPGVARVGQLLCLAGAALGGLGLWGSITGADVLTTWVPNQPPMVPNTAVALLALGIAAALRCHAAGSPGRRMLALSGALVVLAIGVGTLAEYAFGLDLRIDQPLSSGQAGLYPGRPSPPATLALTLLAVALLLFDFRATARARPSEWLILTAGLIALAGLMAQVFGAAPLYLLPRAPVIGVALPTAVSLLLTSAGMLFERPAGGIMRVGLSKGPGGLLLRRLVLPALVAPPLLALGVKWLFGILGVEQLPLMVATLAAAMILAELMLLTVTAFSLERSHALLELVRARTQNLVEQASDAIFVANLNGRYIDVNDAGCRMVGYSREELLRKNIVDLIPAADVSRLWQARQMMLEGGVHVAEWILRRKDGTELPVEVSAKILPDGRWQGLARDISQRKRLEHALRLSEARSSGILAISADAIISIDEDQRITSFNDGAAKVFGYSPAELIGTPIDTLIPERFRVAHRRHVEKFGSGQELARPMGKPRAVFGLRKNGEEFAADAAISRLEVGDTRILTVSLRDVSEQKRIEDEQRFLADLGPALGTTLELEETQSKIAQLVVRDLADFCVVDGVEEDGETRRPKAASQDPEKAWICDAFVRATLDRNHPYPLWSARETRRPVLWTRQPHDGLASFGRSEEHRRLIRALDPRSVISVPLVLQSRTLGEITLISSTPSRIYGEADMRLAEELARRAALSIENARLYRAARRAIKARDETLGIIAHDLRNPLGAILMQAGLLGRRGAEPERRSRKPVDRIERAASRMNRLIQDLLDVSRMEAGRLTLEPTRVSAAQLVGDAVEVETPLAASSSRELALDVAPGLPEVWADRDRLLQVFENLIGNALKFTKPGGRITVGAASGAGEVLFWVADTGPGIKADDLPHLFDRFWQARKAERSGAGLGLPIVKGIIEAHGGKVSVESTPGHGSTFYFTVPTVRRTKAWRSALAPVKH
jgi:PAS domain S-box-containing protein